MQCSQGSPARLALPERPPRGTRQFPAICHPYLAAPSCGGPAGRTMTRLKGKTVLFFAGPLYEDLELWYPKIRLEEEGARTVVAGTGEKTYQGKRGYPLTVDVDVDMISAAEFDGLVIPGGDPPGVKRRPPKPPPPTPGIPHAGKP